MTERNKPEGDTAAGSNEPIEAIGINVAERIYAGLAVGHKIEGELLSYPPGPVPQDSDEDDALVEMPTESLVEGVCDLALKLASPTQGILRVVTPLTSSQGVELCAQTEIFLIGIIES